MHVWVWARCYVDSGAYSEGRDGRREADVTMVRIYKSVARYDRRKM